MSKTEDDRKLSASQRVELYIKKAIYSGALRPRERIIEEDIASRLKCSRGPVRSAAAQSSFIKHPTYATRWRASCPRILPIGLS